MCIMTEQSEEWSIVFYTDEGGCTPVEDFLSDLDLKTQRDLTGQLSSCGCLTSRPGSIG